ncbi:MFS general substrate transporter [Aureobasidium sp. EXF-8845]|nr:MFS general substrate transporter [Aureobasidium sp. EXF-8845]KAI4848942.1 MFS general substrate transporter [Aureobasidium sp. EXF-8846]
MATGSSKDVINVLEVEQPSPTIDKLPDVYETEITPLLGSNAKPNDGILKKDESAQMSPRTILVIMGVMILIVQCGDQLSEAPFTRIFESIYCYQYWEQEDPTKILIPRSAVGPGALGGVEEQWCKVAEVQGKVAMLKGTQQFLDCIPSLLLSIPVGILADRWGRRQILVAGLCAFPLKIGWQLFVCWFWQSFNLQVSWFSALHAIIFGGSPVLSALFFVVISDITDQDSRSAILLRIYSANLSANLLCPPIAAWIMTRNPLAAVFLGLAFFCMGIPLSLLIPETLGYQRSITSNHGRSDEEASPEVSKNPTRNFLEQCYKPLVESVGYFLHDARVTLLIITFVPLMLTVTIVPLLLQYASSRYGLTFASVTMLLTVRAGVTIAMFLCMQSFVYRLLANAGVSGQKRDLVLARGSAGLMVIGWIAVGLSPNAILFTGSLMVATLGNGFPVYLRSFLTGLVEPNKVAELYTIIGVVDTLGLMLGGPLLAWLFERGMSLGGTFVGLPFVALGLIYAVVVSFLLRITHHASKTAVEEDADSRL